MLLLKLFPLLDTSKRQRNERNIFFFPLLGTQIWSMEMKSNTQYLLILLGSSWICTKPTLTRLKKMWGEFFSSVKKKEKKKAWDFSDLFSTIEKARPWKKINFFWTLLTARFLLCWWKIAHYAVSMLFFHHPNSQLHHSPIS